MAAQVSATLRRAAMRVAILSTYPPRPCGIGTFSYDLRSSMVGRDLDVEVGLVSLVRDPSTTSASEVLSVVRQDVRADYLAVPDLLDAQDIDVVLIEHEYGIFGGDAGSYVLPLIRSLRQPFVVTLHTVLSRPSPDQADVLRTLCQQATLVTVFTETARRMIVDSQVAAAEKVRVVPHGAPQVLVDAQREESPDAAAASRDHAFRGRTVLSTFGLISAGKGIETAIRALVDVVPTHPEVLYLVAGQTHPEVVKSEGEQYRLTLERLVRELGLTDQVRFLDRFLSEADLATLLWSTDVYLTPYRSKEQIVSGALTFAIAAGCPVVSTPYFYATDLLSDGAGVLVEFDDPPAFAAGILALLDDPDRLAAAAARSRAIGASLAWPEVAVTTVDVLREAWELGSSATAAPEVSRVASSPTVRADHLRTLVDDVGIVQHADGVVPNRSSGYCTDDMARLVVVALGLDRESDDHSFGRMVAQGLSFLRHAWPAGAAGMHNMMSYDRRWLDDPHPGDHVGRAIWALGAVLAAQPPRAVVAPSRLLLEQLVDVVASTDSPRTMAYTLIGLTRPALSVLPPGARDLLPIFASRLAERHREGSRPDWPWFEDILAYDNARLPQALIAAGHRLGDQALIEQGVAALDWYSALCDIDGPFVRLVGNHWHRPSEIGGGSTAPADRSRPDDGDEQPLDAAALVECLAEAYLATGEKRFARQGVHAFEWFLGRNRLDQPVYDFATGGCHDGMSESSLNDNEGAESTLAFFQALLGLEAAGLQSSLLLA